MTLYGHIKNGIVVFDEPIALPDGIAVTVEVAVPPRASAESGDGQTLLERMRPIVGSATGLPSDAARNVDHYLYGQPPR